ncbi:CAP domain-containing protein [Clostridium chromiireducens]|uniref:CAP domain-containing protein n=1 Tax=Clostridium chromiireducens TaxID=225345 RepID=A0A1V4IK93_9CLOT|nr:CAP domain-containing protein [Clostridium chromiireducens]OPJ60244.1 cysteine-rich secretory protein family protein [Clostridium chromiireducens]RII34149.1 CAP domain-containing protein [Clostridium chromiireducens]
MRKNLCKKMVTAVIAATTMASFSSLGVSAATVSPYTTTTTASTSKAVTTISVTGLPKLPTKYPISVQASAEQKILELMNAKRTAAGLKPLTMDNTLLQVARYKSDDMIQYNFFSHTNPDGTKWVNWLQTIGYKYTSTGENIAYNTYDAVELFNQWWNSPGHRANMMNSSYNKVGIGVIQGNGKIMGTQTFSN